MRESINPVSVRQENLLKDKQVVEYFGRQGTI